VQLKACDPAEKDPAEKDPAEKDPAEKEGISVNQFVMIAPAADMPARSGTNRGSSEATGGLSKATGVGQRNRWACVCYITIHDHNRMCPDATPSYASRRQHA
jgi:hypothetical protein